MFRVIAAVAPLLVGAYYFLQDTGYSRVVDRTPEEVAMGLADLDITDQPGAPGTDPARAGGVMPMFKRERTADGMVWKVMSGSDVAITMTAYLTPVEGGKRTKVTAGVERGNAPDDFVSPAFRSEGITMGLFAMALEDELNELTAAMTGDRAACEELIERFTASNLASADLHSQDSHADAVGDVAKIAMKLHAFEAESRRLGCDLSGPGGFQRPTSQMGDPDAPSADVGFAEPEAPADDGGGWAQ